MKHWIFLCLALYVEELLEEKRALSIQKLSCENVEQKGLLKLLSFAAFITNLEL